MIASVTDYAKSIQKTRQAVLLQIKEKRLPENVRAEKIGKTWVIEIKAELC